MKKVVTRIMAAFLTMTLILLNIPVTILAVPSNEGEFQVTVYYDSDQVDITKDETLGKVLLMDKYRSKPLIAYGSVWLALTQYGVKDGKADYSTQPDEKRKAKEVKLYEIVGGKENLLAIFNTESGTLGEMILPQQDGEIHGAPKRYGCKILLRPPLTGETRTYKFEVTSNEGDKCSTGTTTIKVKKLFKPTLIPPTVGKTDGFTKTKAEAGLESSIRVYANSNIKLKTITFKDGSKYETLIDNGTLLIDALRSKSRMDAKKKQLKEKLSTLSTEELIKYSKAIDYRSAEDKEWTPISNIDTLVDFRVDREDIYFITDPGEPVKIRFDRDYIGEVEEALATGSCKPKYHSKLDATVHYCGNWGDLLNGGLDDAINATSTELLVMVSTVQNASLEDGSLAGATYNNALSSDLYNDLYSSPNAVIKYKADRDKFFTEVKLNIVALYTGETEKSPKLTNRNVRSFIFTNQSGEDTGTIFPDMPQIDVQALEIPAWSALLTSLAKDGKFKVGRQMQILSLYDSKYDNKTILAASDKNSFIGVDSSIGKYGSNSVEYIIDGQKSDPDTSYYEKYFSDGFVNEDRFFPGSIVFTPTGLLGRQIGYRIVYEEELLKELKELKALPDGLGDNEINAMNALIALDTDAYYYYTKNSVTQKQLAQWLYQAVSPSKMQAAEFMIDSFQDFTEGAGKGNIGTVSYDYKVGSGSTNHIVPYSKGNISYTIEIVEPQLVLEDNEYSDITTTIDIRNAKDKVYDGSNYVMGVTPKTIIDTDSLTFKVEKWDGTKWVYDPTLTQAAKLGSEIKDGILTIVFDQKGENGYFKEVTKYQVNIMFYTTLESDFTVSAYRKSTDLNRHLPYSLPNTSRYRVFDVDLLARCQKSPTESDDLTEEDTTYEPYSDLKEIVIEAEYMDFIDIK